jgi:hypothetical protein
MSSTLGVWRKLYPQGVRMISLMAPAMVVCFASLLTFPSDEELTEQEKIEALIKHVEGLKDSKFVRNGKEYDAETAGRFLRGKWKAREKDVKTASDFIEHVGSESSTTGKPYMIRLKGGKEMKSADYLRAELKKLETKD